ncbi:AcrR family transcriptional regulator [Nocardia transvalensis]|uniref:AcrR family transcriptional regulator n=1 Tax=Nocardia transvalensis TaxID=37333 RepID=A0A7W9UGK2_9NOCA|nr:TetR/AcrR family transcriptional regulator [Nocardia transvalensis]MBB5911760.1 AcrR family transcriptional regulator [Nocardia transvalensis]
MPTRRRLTPDQRREQLLEVGATLFAELPYEQVQMDQVAARAGVSRALLYRHFPGKRDLFAAVYRQAADRLLVASELDPADPFPTQLAMGLDAHIDYFAANRNTVLAANRTLAGDPVIQAIISEEMAVLRDRLLASAAPQGAPRRPLPSVLLSWLVFVQVMSLEWLERQDFSRAELRDTCIGALLGALGEPDPSRRHPPDGDR